MPACLENKHAARRLGGGLACMASVLTGLAIVPPVSADDGGFPSPSGQVYLTHYGSESASSLIIEFGPGEGSGSVTITEIGISSATPPAGNLAFGTLGMWRQADDGSVTISGTLYFLPNAGEGPDSVTCARWEASYVGAEQACWFDPHDISYGPLLPY